MHSIRPCFLHSASIVLGTELLSRDLNSCCYVRLPSLGADVECCYLSENDSGKSVYEIPRNFMFE